MVNPFDQTTTSLVDFAKSGPKSEEKIVKPSNLFGILIETWMTNRYIGLLLPSVIDVFNLKINRPISSSFKVTVILVTLQRNFDKIDEKFTYTMYGSK